MATSQLSLPTSFNSSPLVRLLASLDIVQVADARQTVAEKLSHWVAWTDAIAMSRVLADDPAPRVTAVPSGGQGATRRVVDHYSRVRSDLADAITHDALLIQDSAEPGQGGAQPAAGGKLDYSAYRRQYRAHQHTMEDRIGALRARVRSAVTAISPALGRLAALDAALDMALGAHQRRLLEKVPLMLEKRFQAMHKRAQAQADAAPDKDGPAPPSLPIGRTLQRVLLAELETRMQPVQGLIDALGNNAARPA
jgi:hypothetical protein